ncbi:MAG: hypothetical protein LAP13_24335 [Acidobacteriia bacterium]|nr:hypothetical protein [Terriglobia bacterium]
MRTEGQLRESIQRFQESFWNRKSADRPPVGVYDERMFLPINFLRRPYLRPTVSPDDVTGELVMTEYEYSFANRAVSCDDYTAFSAAWRGVPWLEACCGCAVGYAEGSLAPRHFVESPEDLANVPIPAANGWFDRLRCETGRLEAQAPPDCWISPSILRGPSDVLAAMRGLSWFLLDLYDNPLALLRAAARIGQLLIETVEMHYSIVEPKLGGFGHIFGYWAPGSTVVIQEDAMGMCSPDMYRDIFMQSNAELVHRLGKYVLFHLHTTGYKHYKHVLDIPGIAGLEIGMESIGPTILDLVPVFREILEKSRLILHVGTGFELLPQVLRKLPTEGLFLGIPDKYVRNDQEFHEFTKAMWKS